MKPQDVINQAAELFGISVERIISRDRTREIAAVRAAIIWALERRYPELSMQAIVELLNLKDRKSAYNALDRCNSYMRESHDYRVKVYILAGLVVEQQPPPQPLRVPGAPDSWARYNAALAGTTFAKSA